MIRPIVSLMRGLGFAFLFVSLSIAGPALAQYPAKPIRLVHPFPPGGSTDAIVRALAKSMAVGLGQPVVVDNRSGADGVIAAQTVMNSPPDGYTLLFATNTALNAAPLLHNPAPYDPVADFTPVGMIGMFGLFVAVGQSSPPGTLAQFLQYGRANPGKLSFASASSTGMLAIAQLARDARVDATMVPYRGDAPLSVDLIAGRIDLSVMSGSVGPQVKEGNLRLLATLLPNRSPLFPDVPTLTETGAAPIAVVPWTGIFGPAHMPRAIVERLNRELNQALAGAEVRELMERLAVQPQPSTPENLAEMVRTQLAAFRISGKAAGLIKD